MKMQISDSNALAVEMTRVAIASILNTGLGRSVPFRLLKTNLKSPVFGAERETNPKSTMFGSLAREIVVSGMFATSKGLHKYSCRCLVAGGADVWLPKHVNLELENGVSAWPCKLSENEDRVILFHPGSGEEVSK